MGFYPTGRGFESLPGYHSMTRLKLNEKKIPTDRWSARVVSPVDLSGEINTDRYGELLVFHPGWGKKPERYGSFLVKLAENGFLPLALDTRYAYADRRTPRSRFSQSWTTGDTNPYFPEANQAGNRWKYRRPTVLLEILRALDLEDEPKTIAGHSDGGRISTLAARASAATTNRLIVINGAGTGDSSGGAKRLASSNKNSLSEIVSGEEDILHIATSAASSVAYAASHPNRFLHEKRMLQEADTWSEIDLLQGEVDVLVFHAIDDELISFDDCEARARLRPWADFTPTEGYHRNIYDAPIQDQIIEKMTA